MSEVNQDLSTDLNRQFSTFYVDGQLFGVDVTVVQEITRSMPMTRVPLAPNFISGLVNLRGQIVTAIPLRQLFKITSEYSGDVTNVVCMAGGMHLALLVDQISDVVEMKKAQFESTPDTVPAEVSKFLRGVYKTPTELLCIIEINKILEMLNE